MKVRRLMAGAAAIAVGGLTLGVATPGYADTADADLEVIVTGTTIAAGSAGKIVTVEIRNHGPGDASGIQFQFDVSGLDDTQVEFEVDSCLPLTLCDLGFDATLPADGKASIWGWLTTVPGAAPGDAGTLTVEAWHDGDDPDHSNNTVTEPVTIAESGVDLTVLVPDVYDEADIDLSVPDFTFLDSPLLPGSETVVWGWVVNHGDAVAHGIELSLTLPEHVSFLASEDWCTHDAGDSSTICEYDFFDLGAGVAILVWFPVQVAEDAPSPAGLTGGVMEARDMAIERVDLHSFGAQSEVELPGNVQLVESGDIDPSDNDSHFTVFVSAEEDEPNGEGGGTIDKLPVTGAQAGLIGTLGAVVVAAGVVLLLIARRRRAGIVWTVD